MHGAEQEEQVVGEVKFWSLAKASIIYSEDLLYRAVRGHGTGQGMGVYSEHGACQGMGGQGMGRARAWERVTSQLERLD